MAQHVLSLRALFLSIALAASPILVAGDGLAQRTAPKPAPTASPLPGGPFPSPEAIGNAQAEKCRTARVFRVIAELLAGIERAEYLLEQKRKEIADAAADAVRIGRPVSESEAFQIHVLEMQARDYQRLITYAKNLLDELERLPPCSTVLTPPPPPPPPPPRPPQPPSPPPAKGKLSAQPHARFTNCEPCQKIVQLLNEYIDRYNAAQDRADLAAQTALLSDITSLGEALNACERQCLPPAPLPGAVAPAPTPPPHYGFVPPTETGFYVGANGGGAFGRSQWNEPGEAPAAPDPSSNLFGLSGALAGGFFGLQTRNGPWLLGAESDVSGGVISGRTSVNCFTPCRTSNHWLATVRGRAGYDLGGATPFVTGGLAVGDVNANVGGFPGASTTQPGWTVGAGVQMPLVGLNLGSPDGVIGKFEWLHVDLGSPAVCTQRACGGTASVRFSADILRLGISIPLSGLLPR